MKDLEVVFDINNGLRPSEVARRVCSIVVGNRDTWEKNDHAWFFGENKEWALIRITQTRYTLRCVECFTVEQQQALQAIIEWRVNVEQPQKNFLMVENPTDLFFREKAESDEMVFATMA